MATQSIRNFTQATGRNLGGLSANTARRPDLPFLPSMGMPKPAPAMAPPPGGRLVPGRSGSMVWQRDSLPTTTPTPPPSSGSAFDSPPSTPEPAPAPSFDNSPLSGDMGLGKPLGSPLSFDLPPLGAPLGSNAPADSPLAGDMGLGKPLGFGGFRAKGGPVRPGAAYVVGEQAPELFVPDRPGQIVPLNNNPVNGRPSTFDGMPSGPTAVVPMGQIPTRAAPLRDTGSAMDRHMSTGLSGQPTRPVGRSINDPQRQQEIAMRRLRSQGDYIGAARLAQSQAWLDARLGGGSAGPSPMPMQRPALPAMPGPAGKLVPGRSAGSMVWQPDAPPTMSMPSAPASSPPAMPSLPAAAMPIVPPQLEGNNPLTGLPLNDRPPMLPFGTVGQGMQGFPGIAPPPPGLYGEAPPRFQEIKVGDMNLIVDSTTGKQVQSYKRPEPLGYEPVPGLNLLLPKGDGADRLPVLQQQGMIEAPRPEAAFMGPMPGKPKLAPYTPPTQSAEAPKIPEGIQYEKDAMGKIIGGVYPTYNDQGKLVMRRIDLDGNGIVTPAEQAAAMQAAGQTPGGVKFSRVQ